MSDKEYDDNNKVSLWKNDRKTEDWHADCQGTGLIGGTPYYVNLVKVKSDNPNAPVFRLTFKEKVKKEDTSDAIADKMLSDNIPF